jgi:hypothetical protein
MSTPTHLVSQPRLFLVRIWDAAPDDDPVDTRRGKVLHVLTGEARYFHSWEDLVGVLQHLAADPGPGSALPSTAHSVPESDDSADLLIET